MLRGSGVDLSGVTLKIGETGWKQQELLLENAGLADTPYKTEFSLFQGGNLQLEALGAGAIDLASASEIPPIFAAQSGGPGSLSIIAVREGNTLTQEVVVPEGSGITDVAGLKGKKVAYVQNTTAHYFLYKALESAGLAWTDIEAVPLSTSDGLGRPAGEPGGRVGVLRQRDHLGPRQRRQHPGRREGHPVRQLRLRLRPGRHR